MARGQVTILIASAIVFILMFLFPPYFVMDMESNGQVHGPIGYHPIWKPPTSEYGYARLHSKDTEYAPVEEVSGERLRSYEVRVNKVGLTVQCIGLVLLTSVGSVVIRKTSKRFN